ncbi:hypothetical protein EDB19DRAFT_1902237 [Suillus lakei]|nr:hypothetical protein EDB19DRAFT_1902237 [Suillus lakei]
MLLEFLVPDSSIQDLGSNAIVTRNSESDQTEDENDKENSQRLMYDRSEDKENKAVVRHSQSVATLPLGSRPGSLLDVEDAVHRRSSSSTSFGGFGGPQNSPEQDLRSPLKEIAQDDPLSPSSKSPFTTRLLQSTSNHPTSSPGASFSDIENEENIVQARVVLRPLYLGILSRTEEDFSQFFSDEKDEGPSFKERDYNELALSLDVGLEPALEVSSTLRRKADNIFEKEQEYVIEVANHQQKQDKDPWSEVHPRERLPKRNAFDVLGEHPKSKAPKRKLEKSEFVVAEAEESDEDELIGFGPIKKDDEEEAEDDDDEKIVEGLVDDAVMDVETEGVDLVQEKFRTKRRDRGIGFDEDSDDDEEDENNRRIRRGMNKKRKIDGDTLEDLGNLSICKQTREWSNEDEDEETRKMVLTEDLNAELREAARNREIRRTYHGSTGAEENHNVPVKVMSERSSNAAAKRPAPSHTDFGLERPNRILENDQEKTKLRSWARGQGGGNQGTGRSAVGAAITGHAKAKVKTGGGSLRTTQAATGSNSVSSAPCSTQAGEGAKYAIQIQSYAFTTVVMPI